MELQDRKHFEQPEQAIAYARRSERQSSLPPRYYIYLDNYGWFVSCRTINAASVLCYGYVQNGTFVELQLTREGDEESSSRKG